MRGEQTESFRVEMSEPGGKRPVGKPICRRADNVSSDVHGLGMVEEWMR